MQTLLIQRTNLLSELLDAEVQLGIRINLAKYEYFSFGVTLTFNVDEDLSISKNTTIS